MKSYNTFHTTYYFYNSNKTRFALHITKESKDESVYHSAVFKEELQGGEWVAELVPVFKQTATSYNQADSLGSEYVNLNAFSQPVCYIGGTVGEKSYINYEVKELAQGAFHFALYKTVIGKGSVKLRMPVIELENLNLAFSNRETAEIFAQQATRILSSCYNDCYRWQSALRFKTLKELNQFAKQQGYMGNDTHRPNNYAEFIRCKELVIELANCTVGEFSARARNKLWKILETSMYELHTLADNILKSYVKKNSYDEKIVWSATNDYLENVDEISSLIERKCFDEVEDFAFQEAMKIGFFVEILINDNVFAQS